MKSKRVTKKRGNSSKTVTVDAAYLQRLEEASKAKPRARGRTELADPRKPSHVPLNSEERKKLHDAAGAMGMPYATWARGTLLIVADWPATAQPIRMGNLGAHRTTLMEAAVSVVASAPEEAGGGL